MLSEGQSKCEPKNRIEESFLHPHHTGRAIICCLRISTMNMISYLCCFFQCLLCSHTLSPQRFSHFENDRQYERASGDPLNAYRAQKTKLYRKQHCSRIEREPRCRFGIRL